VHLLPISVLLSVSTLLMVVWYGFGQDWVMTILYSNYWGWMYSVYLASLFVLMADIAVNQARIMSAIINAFGAAVGKALEVTPC